MLRLFKVSMSAKDLVHVDLFRELQVSSMMPMSQVVELGLLLSRSCRQVLHLARTACRCQKYLIRPASPPVGASVEGLDALEGRSPNHCGNQKSPQSFQVPLQRPMFLNGRSRSPKERGRSCG